MKTDYREFSIAAARAAQSLGFAPDDFCIALGYASAAVFTLLRSLPVAAQDEGLEAFIADLRGMFAQFQAKEEGVN